MKENIFPRVAALLSILLGGCSDFALLNPSGAVGEEQKTLILTALGLMLLVVVPVILVTLVFAWRYRASNKKATYAPDWAHSRKIEIVVWLIPTIIVVILASLAWNSAHKLDPYRPLDSAVKPIVIEAVSLDWKWLFIYPEQNVATVNQLVFPANVPLDFHITSVNVMNSFFIPKLGSQIYAMPGMRTQLHLIANETGAYEGLSANYSGHGFSDMKFKAIAASEDEFNAWLGKARQSPAKLDLARYRTLAMPSEKNPVEYFASVKPGLFDCILHKYMPAGVKSKACEEN
jgi:cytochrome o ubiquinol oxidase subunit 2